MFIFYFSSVIGGKLRFGTAKNDAVEEASCGLFRAYHFPFSPFSPSS
jgi:hypothetical protein